MALGQNIKRLREVQGLTQRQQEDVIRELQGKKQQNEELLTELLKRRA